MCRSKDMGAMPRLFLAGAGLLVLLPGPRSQSRTAAPSGGIPDPATAAAERPSGSRGAGCQWTESQIAALIRQAAAELPGFPVDLALEIAAHESKLKPCAVHVNRDGTRDWGVMQINDRALEELDLGEPLDAPKNVRAGVGYLRRLWAEFEGDPEDLRRKKVACVYAFGPRGCLPRLPGRLEEE